MRQPRTHTATDFVHGPIEVPMTLAERDAADKVWRSARLRRAAMLKRMEKK